MGYYVPETMRTAKRWGLWRLEADKKIPYNAKTAGRASSVDRNAWTDYETAITTLVNGDYNGLGFAIFPEDRIVFIDLDNCIMEDGEPSELAESILTLFPGTYTEYSQSENGLHIVARGTMPRSSYRAEGIEIYTAGRYMAFTGNAYTAAEPAEAQAGINELCSRFNITAAPAADAKPNGPRRLPQRAYKAQSADEIQKIILSSRQGEKFACLLAGDWTGYSSQSEADQAFVNIANAFCNGNDNIILELWERSELSKRRKGQRPDYIARTIKSAQDTHTGRRASGNGRRRNMVDVVKAPAAKKKRTF